MDVLTRFEKARIISARALQLSSGAPPLVEVSKIAFPIDVANLEFNEKVIPLVVIRRYPNGEVKKVSLLEGD